MLLAVRACFIQFLFFVSPALNNGPFSFFQYDSQLRLQYMYLEYIIPSIINNE